MSLASIRPYFRARMNALSYVEHKDGFNFENIPSTLLNRSYHIETPTGTRLGSYDATGRAQEYTHDCVIRVFFKGFRDPASGIDLAMTAADAIVAEVIDTDNRLGTNIKNVYLENVTITPQDETNDNNVLLEITFSSLIIFCG